MTTKLISIYFLLTSYNIKHPDIVLCQVVQECGWEVDSKNVRERNNILGYCSNMTFTSIEACIFQVSIWQRKYYFGGDYYEFLECVYKGSDGDCKRYAADLNYISKLKQIHRKLFPPNFQEHY